MVARQYENRITIDEWRRLECTSDVKHEYIDGYASAIAGGSLTHSFIAANALSLDGARALHETHLAGPARRVLVENYTAGCALTGARRRI